MSQFLTHPIPAVIILLGLLVFFHELGHFVVGRLCGIAVETFSIGFGPRIFGFTRKGTEYRVSWIPLGGYVKFACSHPSEEMPPGLPGQAFLKTSLPKRAATVVAGPIANFILAIVVYTVLGLDGIPHPPPLVGEVLEGSPAAAAGIQYGDRMVRIDDHPIKTWRDIEDVISASPGKHLTVTVDRAGQNVTMQLTPDGVPSENMNGKPTTIGRAGVALGRPPAILTVEDGSSAAAQAGLKTGDRVTAFNAGGNATKIAFYPDLVLALRRAGETSATSVELTVEAAAAPTERGETPPPAEPARQVTLNIAALHAAGSAKLVDRDYMHQLGLRDSSLTIAQATESVATVLQKGDLLLGWNGTPVRDIFALREKLIANNNPEVTLTVLRNLKQETLKVTLKGVDAQRPDGTFTVYILPVVFWGQPGEPEPVIERYDSFAAAFSYGTHQTWDQTRELFNNVKNLITGEIPLKALGGPMLIAKVAGDSARRGWQTFVGSMALISINLGLLNLFPIPVLDGGQLVLMGAEAVRRRPLREAAVENFQKVGFAMILALVVLATYNDLSRFWRSMLESVVGMFQ